MARTVKCHITGEIGTNETFVKIGHHYYKSREIYEEDHRRKEQYKNLVDYICREFLGYGNGQPFPTSLPKKLSELSYYSPEVIRETFQQCQDEIHYWLEHKQFPREHTKISYMFSIVQNNIADVHRAHLHRQKQQSRAPATMEFSDLSDIASRPDGKNISQFLDEEDL